MQDPRVDVCVYFIAPHRLKQMDVEFMKRLSLVSKLAQCTKTLLYSTGSICFASFLSCLYGQHQGIIMLCITSTHVTRCIRYSTSHPVQLTRVCTHCL